MSAKKRLILDLEGPSLNETEKKLLQEEAVLGVILFARNIESRDQVQQLCESIKQVRADLFICVDQEGGRVRRLRQGYTAIPPMAAFGKVYDTDAERGLALARDAGWLLAMELKSTHIDFSFTPVLDLDYGTSEVIGDRAFHSDAEKVNVLAGALIDGLHAAGVGSCGKHFPGHGWVAADSHLELPCDERSLQEIEETDLQPFKALAKKLDSVMPAHVLYNQCDDKPAGFSSFWMEYLRKTLGFRGIVFSDDLAMKGAAEYGSYQQRAEYAFDAGCDVVLVCNDRSGAIQVLDWLKTQNLSAPVNVNGLYAKGDALSWDELGELSRYQKIKNELEGLGE